MPLTLRFFPRDGFIIAPPSRVHALRAMLPRPSSLLFIKRARAVVRFGRGEDDLSKDLKDFKETSKQEMEEEKREIKGRDSDTGKNACKERVEMDGEGLFRVRFLDRAIWRREGDREESRWKERPERQESAGRKK